MRWHVSPRLKRITAWALACATTIACADAFEIQTGEQPESGGSVTRAGSAGTDVSSGGVGHRAGTNGGGYAVEAGTSTAGSSSGAGGEAGSGEPPTTEGAASGAGPDLNECDGECIRCAAPATPCDGKCVDTRFDPDNCGECGRQCDLPHASSLCDEGECHIRVCGEGFVDRDGEPETGCELRECKALESVEISVPDDQPSCQNHNCNGISCEPRDDGGIQFGYTLGGECRAGPEYATCTITPSIDMTGFDESYAGDRLLEVTFCVEEEAEGSLNLWYGRHPLRKRLPLIASGTTLEPDCYVKYFDSADAWFPRWCGIPESCCPVPEDLREQQCDVQRYCPNQECLTAFKEVTESAASSDADLGCAEQEGDAAQSASSEGDADPTMKAFALESVELTLAAEWNCGASGSIHLRSVRFLTPSCRCSEASPCDSASDRSTCYLLDENACAADREADSGVCGPPSGGCTGPPGTGVACTGTAGDQSFVGVTKCVEGSYVCTFE